MTEAELKTPSNAYNDATEKSQLIHEHYNSAYNHHVIIDAFNKGRAMDLNDAPKHKGKAAFIIGSGPSLDLAIPHLRGWKGGIICTTSHAQTLMYHGIEPTHIIALDPFSQWAEISAIDWTKTDAVLVANPGVWPDLIANWPNEMYFYRQSMGSRETFYAKEQCNMYSWREGERGATFHFLIRTELAMFACSPPAQLFVADRLGYQTTFLSGVDFAFSYGKERFTGAEYKDGEWSLHEYPLREDTDDGTGRVGLLHDGPLITNNGIRTQQIHLYYKKNFLTAVRLSLQSVYTTDKGAITELPYADIAEVVAWQGARKMYPKLTKKYLVEHLEPYLASIGCFVIEGKAGYVFAELADPRVDAIKLMTMMNRKYQCNECGLHVELADDHDHNGDNCKRCPTGKIHQTSPVDIAKNMRAINAAIEGSHD